MNKNAEIIKNTLIAYKAKRDAANTQVKYIRDDFGEEAAQRELERQNKRLNPVRMEAENAIRTAAGAEQKAAVAWGKIDGSKLTDDIKLLDAGLVNVDVFNDLKEKYKDNATMLSALKKFGDRQNAEAMKAANEKGNFSLTEPFNVRDIPTAADRVKAWENTQRNALDMLDAIDGTGRYGNPRDWGATLVKNTLSQTLEHFGENL